MSELSFTSKAALSASVEPRIWLFDFDNTLAALEREVDWAGSRIELEQYLRREGVGDQIFTEIPKGNLPLYEGLRARLLEGVGKTGDDCIVGSLAHSNPRELLRCASIIIEKHELRGVEHTRETPGATMLLRRLRQRSSIVAIVTSNSSRTVRAWLDRQNLAECVDLIVGRDAQLPLKPAPDSILMASEECSGSASDCVFVGDSIADAGAARRAQVRLIGIGVHENRKKLIKHGAIAVFETPAALAEELQLLAKPYGTIAAS